MNLRDRLNRAYELIDQVDRPEAWITLRARSDVLAEAETVDRSLPLAGMLFAVKDNIDVAGLPTTAGAPSYSYVPDTDAVAVDRLRSAGALVVGKTNLDQFATGLVGTRSPYGAVRNAWDPLRISGGSSSGSAVVVALGLVDFSLGTDTAGSGRVPAALNGVVGVKPTRGLVPLHGVVPACFGLDCVTVFARDIRLARTVAEFMEGRDDSDPLTREGDQTPAPSSSPRFAIPLPAQLEGMAPGWATAFRQVVASAVSTGATVVEVDCDALLRTAELLYDGAFVAARYAAVGGHLEDHADLVGSGLDPTVTSIILGGRQTTAADWVRDDAELVRLRARARKLLEGFDALLTPATVEHPLIAEVESDPVGVNARLGRFTNFANLLDMASLAVPAGLVAGLPFGTMLTGPAFSDRALAVLAERHLQATVDVFVLGAHMREGPLNRELLDVGATFVRDELTAPSYALFALDTTPPKPGMVRTCANGVGVKGEIWRLPSPGFGQLVAAIPPPMMIGQVALASGDLVAGFLADPLAIAAAHDISEYGGWRAYMADREAH